MNVSSLPRALDGIIAADFNDPTNERIIYLSAAGLVVVGLALLLGTIVWWRRGRQEHPALAPLEVMSARAWEKAPEGDRRRRLDQVRAPGAGAADDSVAAEPVDLQALVRSVPQAFDDLREPGVEAEASAEAEPEVAAEPEEVEAAVEPAEVEAAVEPAKSAKVDEVVVEPVKADPDATAVSIERPEEAFESSASRRTEPSK